MGNLDYPSDLMGVKEVHVFKYADRPALQVSRLPDNKSNQFVLNKTQTSMNFQFQCQITILVKEPNGQCERPTCADPPGRGDGSRRAKRAVVTMEGAAGTMDVASEFETLDINTNVSIIQKNQ